ncbi:MAG: hypothetical protein IJJ80_08680 [Clostridia bacterium]|nr:hypothetical protein [Clostridia bacterium]
MTRQETIKILSVLRAAYPGFYSRISEADAQMAVNVWTEMFCDDDYQLVSAAVKAVINAGTKDGYPPDIGRIKEEIRRFAQPETDTAMAAWNQVRKAISYYNARENFNKLPELARQIVGSPNQLKEWAMMEMEDVGTVVQSNFLKAYRAKEKVYQAQQALPPDVKRIVAALQKGMTFGIDGKKDELEAKAEPGAAGQIASAGSNAGDQTEGAGAGVSHPGAVS